MRVSSENPPQEIPRSSSAHLQPRGRYSLGLLRAGVTGDTVRPGWRSSSYAPNPHPFTTYNTLVTHHLLAATCHFIFILILILSGSVVDMERTRRRVCRGGSLPGAVSRLAYSGNQRGTGSSERARFGGCRFLPSGAEAESSLLSCY